MLDTTLVSAKGSAAAATTSMETAEGLTFAEALQTTQEPEQNIFIAAQKGDVALLRKLIESGQASATDRDEQNITALHWAAINAQLGACKYLLEQGAEVDALGGDLVSTPLQWAARPGYTYVIQLLISHNADPTISDSQGYNTLHLVTHSSSVMALLYLLHQPVAVDSPDAQGHTSLMWAAYQGDALSVDILLKHGASVSIKDQVGLTPLHWAVVRGNKFCIRKLVEAGADLNAKDENGKTPKEMAIELKSLGAYKKALEEGGLNEDGVLIPRQFSERNTKIAIFLIPTLFFYLIFTTLSILPWYTGIVLAMAEFFGMHHIVSRVLLNHSAYTEQVAQSPYFAGIINASLVWVAWAWFSRLVRNTPGFAFTNLAFTLTFLLCAYNFFRSITLDPGSCPKPANDAELKSTIEDLASEGRLNGQSFCVECMARKALRSKHCKVCGKCTARFDHHCPWIWNCVGVNNHRQFVIFVTTLVIGISLFDYLTYQYFAMLPLPPLTEDPSSDSCLFPASLCSLTSHDTFLFSVALWSTLQLTWTLLLLIGQLWQITRQMTTFEVSNLGRYGFMGGRSGTSLAQQQGHQHQHHHGPSLDGVSDMDASSVNGGGHGGHKHRHGACGSGFLLKLLGLDRYTSKNAASGLTKASRASNPFDAGLISNCIDFWTRGRELGVEYERLYVVPGEGFKEAKRRNEREHLDDGPGHGGEKRRGMLMGWGARLRGNNSGGGYLPLRTEEQV